MFLWYKNGVYIPGTYSWTQGNSSSYTTPPVGLVDNGATYTVGLYNDVWHVAAKWSDGHVENITAFESEVEANEWIANDFQEWLERRKKG